MENQENQQEPATNKASPALWVSIILVIIVLGVGAYFLFIQDDTTNTNNENTTINANTTINENVNTVSNTNTETNTNIVVNTNTVTNANVDTSEWETYTNEDLGYTLLIPSEWNVEEISGTAKYVKIKNLEGNRVLEFGVRAIGDTYPITSRILFFADQGNDNSYQQSTLITVDEVELPTTVLINNQKVKQWFLGNDNSITPQINSHEVYSEYKAIYPLSDDDAYQKDLVDTDLTNELLTIRIILQSFSFI